MKVESILIDNQGFLSIERIQGHQKPCFCPIASPNMTIRCGDWCPHFSEPFYREVTPTGQLAEIHLSCQAGTDIKGKLTDNRKEA